MFADLAQRSVDAAFERLGETAIYTPLNGSSLSITVIPTAADELLGSFGGQQVKADAAVFRIRVAEVVTLSKGDQIEWNNTTFAVNGPARREDNRRLVWTVGAVEQS